MEKELSISDKVVLLIRSEIIGDVSSDMLRSIIRQEDLDGIYAFSKEQDLVHIASDVLQKAGVFTDKEQEIKFRHRQAVAMYRYEWMINEEKRIFSAFEKSEFDYMPLKGTVLRDYYPNPSMRISSDIDILVRESDLKAAEQCLCVTCGYTKWMNGNHDISYIKDKIHVELHFALGDDEFSFDDILGTVWEHSGCKEGFKHRFEMTNEFYVFYQVAHIAKHFTNGGCGIRLFADLCIIKNKMKYDEEALREMLKKSGLLKFYETSLELIDCWFGNGKPSKLVAEMQDYIFSSGIYGDYTTKISIAITKRGGKFRYILSRMFLGYRRMTRYYPSVKKFKLLLPFYEIRRWCRIAFCGGAGSVKDELKTGNSIDYEKQKKLANMFEKLGI